MKGSRAKPLERPSGLQMFLRIKHPSLDPAEISRVLGMEPAQAIAAGADVSLAGVRRLHSESYWIAQLPTTEVADLAERFRVGIDSEAIAIMNKDDLIGMMGATEQDLRITSRLKRFEAHKEFFVRINAEGGSVTLILDRGETRQPLVLKRALKKLAGLGIVLEVD